MTDGAEAEVAEGISEAVDEAPAPPADGPAGRPMPCAAEADTLGAETGPAGAELVEGAAAEATSAAWAGAGAGAGCVGVIDLVADCSADCVPDFVADCVATLAPGRTISAVTSARGVPSGL